MIDFLAYGFKGWKHDEGKEFKTG